MTQRMKTIFCFSLIEWQCNPAMPAQKEDHKQQDFAKNIPYVEDTKKGAQCGCGLNGINVLLNKILTVVLSHIHKLCSPFPLYLP